MEQVPGRCASIIRFDQVKTGHVRLIHEGAISSAAQEIVWMREFMSHLDSMEGKRR